MPGLFKEAFTPTTAGVDLWASYLAHTGLSNRDLGEKIIKRQIAIETMVGQSLPVGQEIFPVAEKPISQELTEFLNLGVILHGEDNLISEVGQVMLRTGRRDSRAEDLLTPEEHFAVIYDLAQQLPQNRLAEEVFLTAGQLAEIANHHPVLGFYQQRNSLGRTDKEQFSAFVTPLEWDKRYRQVYGAAIRRAYDNLSTVEEFTSENPFYLILVGDGRGRILQQAVEEINKAGIQDLCQLIVIDKSETLLDEQKKATEGGSIPLTFLRADGRRIGEVLKNLGGNRGVIIAGEELVDDYSGYFIGLDEQKEVGEYVLSMRSDGSCIAGFIPIEILYPSLKPLLLPLFSVWLKAFPYYSQLLERVSARDKKDFIPVVPLNMDLLKMMYDIANSGFRGYWLGGDYSDFFQYRNIDLPAVKVMPMKMPGAKEKLEYALGTVCNVSSDVDLGLFAYAQALGLRLDFLGRTGHFMTALLDKQILSRQEVIAISQRIVQPFLDKGKPPSRKYLTPAYVGLTGLLDYFSGGRFNWVVAVGDETPPLFSSEIKAQVW